jgi:Fe-S cluster biosynthesis and repair protein YggX
VSKKAWEEWLEHQKMLINEGQINLADRDSRKWLNEQMDLFLLEKIMQNQQVSSQLSKTYFFRVN